MNATDRIRQLLDAYYNGDATPEQTAEIARLFAEADFLPADLAAEKEIFDTISDIKISHTEDLPEDLNRIYAEAVEKATGSTPKRSGATLWIRLGGIAAAIAVMITAGITMNISENTLSSDETALTSSIPTDTAVNTPSAKTEVLTCQETEYPAAAQQPEPTPVKKKKKRKATDMTSSNTRVITDPAEAGEYTGKAFALLAENLSLGREASQQAGDVITEINQKIDNTLKIIMK